MRVKLTNGRICARHPKLKGSRRYGECIACHVIRVKAWYYANRAKRGRDAPPELIAVMMKLGMTLPKKTA